jgi:uncharacterized membrane protein YvbJ
MHFYSRAFKSVFGSKSARKAQPKITEPTEKKGGAQPARRSKGNIKFPIIAPDLANIIARLTVIVLNVVGNKSMITVKTTLVATLADAINKDDKDTTIAELVEKYMEQAHNPEMMPKISEKNCVV